MQAEKTKETAIRRVLAVLSMQTRAGRGMAAGMLRYAATHPRLSLIVANAMNEADALPVAGTAGCDGIIAPQGMMAELDSPKVRAAVFLHSPAPEDWGSRPFAEIYCDNEGVGRLAAEHLLKRHLRHFGYIGTAIPTRWSNERLAGFAGVIKAAGCDEPLAFGVDAGRDLVGELERMERWMRSLPKPCGVFASSDWRAKLAADACRAGGIAVPETVQLLGVDNEEYVCEMSVPPLSSIEPDFEGGGYEAVKTLDAMMKSAAGRKPETIVYGLRGVVERQSTRDDKGTARIVNLALDFIRQHGASGGTAAEAVKVAGCSASLLQRYFRKTLGRTVVQEIQRVRLEKACRLLRHTETPIGEIASLCGYEDESFMKDLFRRAYRMSMRDYRRNRAGPI